MSQLSEEQQEPKRTCANCGRQIYQIVKAHNSFWEHEDTHSIHCHLTATPLLDSDSQAPTPAEGIADDLPYRIVEEMGFGLTFRSCTCGQLPCARLRPLRDALETVRLNTAVLMRDKCVEKVKEMRDQHNRDYDYWKSIASDPDRDFGVLKFAAWAGEDERVIEALESLTLDQVKPGEM